MEEDRPDTRHELEMLCNRHDIGFILINIKKPEENSKILIPARERAEIDWNMANRLAEENKDFENYMKLVSKFYRDVDTSDSDTKWFNINEHLNKRSKKQKMKH